MTKRRNTGIEWYVHKIKGEFIQCIPDQCTAINKPCGMEGRQYARKGGMWRKINGGES